MVNSRCKFRMWNNIPENPSKSKMFYDTENVMECLKQQMWHNEGKQFGYDHTERGCVFMQGTGLLDKHGKEIFEGDKCKITFYNHVEKNTEIIMNIVFVDGGFALIKEGKITTESIIEDDRTFVPLYYSQRPNNIEIIGNVFENPELTERGNIK